MAVLVPSSRGAAAFPHMRDQAARRLGDILEMKVRLMETCYLSTDQLSPERRAADFRLAFEDHAVGVIVATSGGDDAIRVLRHLDVATLAANPKPFLGCSEATSIHLALYEAGVLSFYGDALLTRFALAGPAMHSYTQEALLATLFGAKGVPVAVSPSEAYLDNCRDWSDPTSLDVARDLEENPGWEWWHVSRTDTDPRIGTLWGGCLEVLYKHLATGICLPNRADLNGAVLFVETSARIPCDETVYSFFQCLGELGYLARFAAILVGRPLTVCRGETARPDRDTYKRRQKRAVLRAVREYSDPLVPVVFDLDFGHTDPQIFVPVGGTCRVYPHSRTITFTYQRAPR